MEPVQATSNEGSFTQFAQTELHFRTSGAPRRGAIVRKGIVGMDDLLANAISMYKVHKRLRPMISVIR